MQKKLLTTAVAAALLAPVAAMAQATLYGKVDLNYQNIGKYSATSPNKSGLANSGQTSSRLGVKTAENLGGGLQAIAVIEFDIAGDTGATSAAGMTQRATYVGIQNEKVWGTLSFGRQLTHSFAAMMAGDGNAGANSFNTYYQLMDGNTRSSNYIKWSGPNWNGFTLGIGAAPGESTAAATGSNGNYWDMAVLYNKGNLGLGFGHAHSRINTPAAAAVAFAAGPPTVLGTAAVAAVSRKEKDTSFAISYKFGPAKVSGITTTSKASGTGAAENLRMHGVKLDYTVKSGYFSVTYGKRKNKLAATADSRLFALGYYHGLSKRTNVYAAYGSMRNDAGAAAGATSSLGGAWNGAATTAGSDPRGFQVGMNHTF
ncbi:MAG: porin [Proteobacteria bacterium]|nr:porin [Pseudomonadota bacterium]